MKRVSLSSSVSLTLVALSCGQVDVSTLRGDVEAITHTIAAANLLTCALDETSIPVCWGDAFTALNEDFTAIPRVAMTTISAFLLDICGIDYAGDLHCFGVANSSLQTDIPNVRAHSVGVGWDVACALDEHGTLHCWGERIRKLGTIPEERFVQIDCGRDFCCALGATGAPVCFGDEAPEMPKGSFVEVSVGAGHVCLREEEGSLACAGVGDASDLQNWTDDFGIAFGQAIPPEETFTFVSAGELHSCGVRHDATVECWGAGTDAGDCSQYPSQCGQSRAPSETFVEVAAGNTHSCGVTGSSRIVCWGGPDGTVTPPESLSPRK